MEPLRREHERVAGRRVIRRAHAPAEAPPAHEVLIVGISLQLLAREGVEISQEPRLANGNQAAATRVALPGPTFGNPRRHVGIDARRTYPVRAFGAGGEQEGAFSAADRGHPVEHASSRFRHDGGLVDFIDDGGDIQGIPQAHYPFGYGRQ